MGLVTLGADGVSLGLNLSGSGSLFPQRSLLIFNRGLAVLLDSLVLVGLCLFSPPRLRKIAFCLSEVLAWFFNLSSPSPRKLQQLAEILTGTRSMFVKPLQPPTVSLQLGKALMGSLAGPSQQSLPPGTSSHSQSLASAWDQQMPRVVAHPLHHPLPSGPRCFCGILISRLFCPWRWPWPATEAPSLPMQKLHHLWGDFAFLQDLPTLSQNLHCLISMKTLELLF